MRNKHRSATDLSRLMHAQLIGNGSEEGCYGYVPGLYGTPQLPANRKERRALAALKRKGG